jgi:hypothetical protein
MIGVRPTETATRQRVSAATRPKTITTASPSRPCQPARTILGDRRGVLGRSGAGPWIMRLGPASGAIANDRQSRIGAEIRMAFDGRIGVVVPQRRCTLLASGLTD